MREFEKCNCQYCCINIRTIHGLCKQEIVSSKFLFHGISAKGLKRNWCGLQHCFPSLLSTILLLFVVQIFFRAYCSVCLDQMTTILVRAQAAIPDSSQNTTTNSTSANRVIMKELLFYPILFRKIIGLFILVHLIA